MITAFKALWKAVSWGLKGVLGLLRQRGSLDWAVNRAVDRAVNGAVWNAEFWALEDPDHPALDDFLRSVGGES